MKKGTLATRHTERLVLAALFLAFGVILPSLTGAIKEIGDSLLPMHLMVMLCGVICGWKYGLCVGLVLPFLRSLIFGMPPIYPNSVWMSLELATYGVVIGIMYFYRKKFSRLLDLLDDIGAYRVGHSQSDLAWCGGTALWI